MMIKYLLVIARVREAQIELTETQKIEMTETIPENQKTVIVTLPERGIEKAVMVAETVMIVTIGHEIETAVSAEAIEVLTVAVTEGVIEEMTAEVIVLTEETTGTVEMIPEETMIETEKIQEETEREKIEIEKGTMIGEIEATTLEILEIIKRMITEEIEIDPQTEMIEESERMTRASDQLMMTKM